MRRDSVVKFHGFSLILKVYQSIGVILLLGCSGEIPQNVFVISPQMLQLGEIREENGPAEARFEIINNLSEPVKILEIAVGCKCTKATLSINPIPAHQTAILIVSVDPTNTRGKQVYSVSLVTDSNLFPRHSVSVGAVVSANEIDTSINYRLGNFLPGAALFERIPMYNSDGVDFKLVEFDSAGTDLQAELCKGDVQELVVRGTTPHEAGSFNCIATLSGEDTDGSLESRKVLLKGYCVPRWNVPKDLYLGFFSKNDPSKEFKIEIESSGQLEESRELVGVEVRSDDSWVAFRDVSWTDILIRTTFDVDAAREDGRLKSTVNFRLNYSDGSHENLQIPVFARVKDYDDNIGNVKPTSRLESQSRDKSAWSRE